jgi:hypothetical protein
MQAKAHPGMAEHVGLDFQKGTRGIVGAPAWRAHTLLTGLAECDVG